MSRIGKVPVALPDGVNASVEGTVLKIKGPKGELTLNMTGGISAAVDGGHLALERPDDVSRSKALLGLYRALSQNMVEGVTKGFEKRLEVKGVSYQASVDGNKLKLLVGFSHPVFVSIPKGLTVTTPKPTLIVVEGIDKQLVGQFAASVRKCRPPEPYKGKGVRYLDEHVVQKAGKSFVGGEK